MDGTLWVLGHTIPSSTSISPRWKNWGGGAGFLPTNSPTPKLEGSVGPPYVASKVHGLHRAHILKNFELGQKLFLLLKFEIEISLKN
jgi:hypothetical protein